jgi:hypothetical protein
MTFLETGVAQPGRLEGKPSPEPLPRWGQAERAAAAQQGMSAPVAGADDWYGTHRDAGAAPAPLPTPQALHQQAEQALQDVAGQVDTAVKALFVPPAPAVSPQV